MNSFRVVITLSQQEAAALSRLAEIEIRDPRDQARLILRQAFEQRGLLNNQEYIEAQPQQEAGCVV